MCTLIPVLPAWDDRNGVLQALTSVNTFVMELVPLKEITSVVVLQPSTTLESDSATTIESKLSRLYMASASCSVNNEPGTCYA